MSVGTGGRIKQELQVPEQPGGQWFIPTEETGGRCAVGQAEISVWTCLVPDEHGPPQCRTGKGDVRTDGNVLEFSMHESLQTFETDVIGGRTQRTGGAGSSREVH